MYDALNELIGAKVTYSDDDTLVFDNGIRIKCEDLSNYIDVSQYKEASR